jgi:GDPmannose 4,6-dehydratase
MTYFKKAIITGVTGQDGSYLAELLLEKGYIVYGIIRRSSVNNLIRVKHLIDNPNFYIKIADLTDSSSVTSIIKNIVPDEIYNLGAQSHVQVSFDTAESTGNINALGPLRILESIRILGMADKVRYYQASTSEMFGKVQEVPQKETTPFYPRSPYGVAKLYGHWITKNYRESYGMYACSGILFNHESPRRGENFVTSKIVLSLSAIANKKQDVLELGNLDAFRDWGHAKDYVAAMWLMLQQDTPDDYIISTGEQHSVRDFVEIAAKHYGFEIVWQGEGVDEVGVDKFTGNVIVRVNPKFYRPLEVDTLLGDSTKAHKVLGWTREYSFEQLVQDMASNINKTFPEYSKE